MNYEKDDKKGIGQPAWAAKEDIAARAEAAYQRHSAFFDSVGHQHRVALAVQLAKGAVKLYDAVYETARDGRSGPFTEVKINRVEFAHGARNNLVDTLKAFGFMDGDFEYRVQSQSFRIFVR